MGVGRGVGVAVGAGGLPSAVGFADGVAGPDGRGGLAGLSDGVPVDGVDGGVDGAGAVTRSAGVGAVPVPVPDPAPGPSAVGVQPTARTAAAAARTAARMTDDERFIDAPPGKTACTYVCTPGMRPRRAAVAHVTESRRACCEEGPSGLLSSVPHARHYSPQRGVGTHE
ncbi:hypothetical protein SLA_4732 [Streptomyces laurentii]|uniref:Uncharacterized protein n=1 Tax=Streptomyces laurentii TaxID=39478 RepID=A0A160P3Y5_STRLU|nr:hypothetical protein SLA_4732 [Streptomyces laurentii]